MIYNISKCVYSVLSIVFFYSSVSLSSERPYIFEYSPDGDSGLRINVRENSINSFGSDHIQSISKCSDKYQLICLSTPDFKFSIPRHDSIKNNWKFERFYYERSEEKEREILGVKYKGTSIFQSKTEHWREDIDIDSFYPIEYFFSIERGLISISWLHNSPFGPNTFVLKSKCGFASNINCEN